MNLNLRKQARDVFSIRTRRLIRYDLIRLSARLKRWRDRNVVPPKNKLHFGCGTRHVPGWLNVDVAKSEYDVDLASGRLPWKDSVFDVAVSLHFIEHIELAGEFIP